MSRTDRPRIHLNDHLALVVTDDGSATLFDERRGETFHSESGAAAESRCVFLENSGVAERLQKQLPTAVLEIGLGTGLNFLLTAEVARQYRTPLVYTAVDNRWINRETLQQLRFEQFISDSILLASWLRFSENLPPPMNSRLGAEFEFAELRFDLGDALELQFTGPFDAIYHDAFSPASSPELWSPQFLRRLYDELRPDGNLVTYCVKRQVREAMQEAGFFVAKAAGPVGGKREVLVATKRTMA
jgi:tRNA U34 5-methylaminomethyl-2-thiouridine-forming methyltransferase MnmC